MGTTARVGTARAARSDDERVGSTVFGKGMGNDSGGGADVFATSGATKDLRGVLSEPRADADETCAREERGCEPAGAPVDGSLERSNDRFGALEAPFQSRRCSGSSSSASAGYEGHMARCASMERVGRAITCQREDFDEACVCTLRARIFSRSLMRMSMRVLAATTSIFSC